MNHILQQDFDKFNNIVNKKAKFLLNDKTLDKDLKFQYLLTLSTAISLASGVEIMLTLCSILKIELPSDISNKYQNRVMDFVNILSKLPF